MKVKELKKINEFAHINHFNMDYECLLQIQEKDISKILDLIDLKSTNVESLIHFLTYEVDVSDWEHGFAHMKGIENFNIREYIIEKITNAPSKIVSNLIYKCFNPSDGDLSHLDLFKDINEYQTYIESITNQTTENKYLTSSIMLALEKLSLLEHEFTHMKGIENFNVREYIIEKITNAPSKIVSDLIYRYFDLNDGKASHLDLFNDINEYQAYMENITDQMAENEELVISNIMLVLEKVSFTDDRSELIKKTMIYSQKKELLPESLNACFEKLFHIELTPYFSEILLLLLKGYKIGTVCNFFRKWHEDAKSREKDKVNESYEFVEKYLLESKFSDCLEDNNLLMEIFSHYDTKYDKYRQITKLFIDIEDSEDKELFNECLKYKLELSNDNVRSYIYKILESSNKDFNNSLRQSLLYLLKNKRIDAKKFFDNYNRVLRVVKKINLSNTVDGNGMDMAKFITSINDIDILNNMAIKKENHDTRKVIYSEFPKFVISGKLNFDEIQYYNITLKRLVCLPPDICEKVMKILNLPLVRSMDIEKQSKLKELILSPENYGSLEYIYNSYKEKEKEYDEFHRTKFESNATSYNPEVSLVTVAELLECDHNIDEVLDGFGDDDEITPKTLIRSLAYKNNQNN